MGSYRHVLIATDFSELGELAIRRGCELARAQGAAITLVHVLPELTSPSPFFAHYELKPEPGRRERAAAEALDALRKHLPPGFEGASREVLFGDPADEILALAGRLPADLIVLATHGRRGFERWRLGSVSERVVRAPSADVLIVRPPPESE
ncbi:MAG: universal stress protein [Sandaracinaceae bacterium]|nr:universal stress protein [Sandaracinaceae bacterium]